MTSINVTLSPSGVWMSADSAFCPVPAGMVTPTLSTDVETIRRGTFRDTPGPRPVISGFTQKVFRVGSSQMVISATGHLWPLLELGAMIARAGWTLDEAVERAPAELRQMIAQASEEPDGVILLAGWSDAEGRALAFVLPMDGGPAQRLADGHMNMPLPDHRDPDYRQLFALYSLPPGEQIELLHAALALNQAAAARDGRYKVPLAIGGEVLLMRVDRHGVEQRPLLDLGEAELD